MSRLTEIEAAISKLSPEELLQVERVAREVRRRQITQRGASALDLPPLELGRVLRPLGAADDVLGEMLDDARF